jgi:cytochrome P450
MPDLDTDLSELEVSERWRWSDGPPHELFSQLRGECPVHWSAKISEYPDEAGYWSVTAAEDVRAVSRDWETFSSERGGVAGLSESVIPLELARLMFVAMDPPKHDRIKALFQAGFTPRRIADHEQDIRALVVETLDALDGREECDLVAELAVPVVSRVMGRFLGTTPEEDEVWLRLTTAMLGAANPDVNPEGPQTVMERDIPELFARCAKLIAERREQPRDDLTSVLVHAEIDGERLEEGEIIMGFLVLLTAGFDSTKATFCSGMRALIEHPEQRELVLADHALIPGAIEETLRMFPPATHFRRTATRDTELGGCPIREGEKVVMWYVSSNRDERRYEDPQRFDVTRNPEHDAFGAGGRHFCLGSSLARLELRILFEETLARYPRMEAIGPPDRANSMWLNQLDTLRVRLNP